MKRSSFDLDLLYEFQKFIIATQNGKRRKKNGSKILKESLRKLQITYRTLEDFSRKKSFKLRIKVCTGKNKREQQIEKYYWKKFYQKFSDYLYNDLDCYDNYAGSVIKDVKTFFNYLVTEKNLSIGNFYKQFYVYKEDIQILILHPHQLNYLIHDKTFEENLRPVLKKVKDILVAGCTVALRYSDLMNLKTSNLELVDRDYYLRVQSKKSKIYTRVKLPAYVTNIFKKYGNRGGRLLPYFNLTRLNLYLKELAEYAGWINETIKTRQKRGIAIIVYKNIRKKTHYRFCDLVSSHIMRRTAITTMLRLQMPEHLVKKISGHSPDSREFHKYVSISQSYLDNETDKVFERLKSLHNNNLPVFEL